MRGDTLHRRKTGSELSHNYPPEQDQEGEGEFLAGRVAPCRPRTPVPEPSVKAQAPSPDAAASVLLRIGAIRTRQSLPSGRLVLGKLNRIKQIGPLLHHCLAVDDVLRSRFVPLQRGTHVA